MCIRDRVGDGARRRQNHAATPGARALRLQAAGAPGRRDRRAGCRNEVHRSGAKDGRQRRQAVLVDGGRRLQVAEATARIDIAAIEARLIRNKLLVEIGRTERRSIAAAEPDFLDRRPVRVEAISGFRTV